MDHPDTIKEKPSIAILGGNGKFGAWFVRFFEKEGLSVKVLGRQNSDHWSEEIAKADIVIVSVPIAHTSSTIEQVRDHVRSDALLCDFTSIKEVSMEAMLKTKTGCGVTGIHPMFGPLITSLTNQTVVFCSGRDNKWTDFLKTLFEKRGARIVESTAQEHDESMAVVQALTHYINILFGAMLSRQNTQLLNTFSSPVFRVQSILSARVLGGKADMYGDIAIANPSFRKILEELDEECQTLSRAVKEEDIKKYTEVYEKSAQSLKGFIPLAQASSMELFNLVDRQSFTLTRSEEETTKVPIDARELFVLGPEGTFSHSAAKNVFDKKDITFCSTIQDVFERVLKSGTGLGMVPIENSTQGIVQESLDCFTRFPVVTIGSYDMPIHLCLFGRADDISEVQVIKSHPQPLAQSGEWLRNNVPEAKLEPAASSAKAILETQEDDTKTAFIGSKEAAEKYGLTVLAENIEDKKNNSTEFYIIAGSDVAEISKPLQVSRTALILIIHDRPGVLRDILDAFAKRSLNLTKLHSKSSDMPDCDYYFFLEFEGSPESEPVQKALEEIDRHCYIKRVLGRV